MRVNQKGFSAAEILVVIVVVGLLGAVGWLVYDRQKSPKQSEATQQSTITKTPPTTVTYLTLDQGDGSSNNLDFSAQNRVIKNSDEWRQFWKELYFGDKPEPPADSMPIDFDTKMVIAVVMGSRGEVALNIKKVNIERIEDLGNSFTVQTTVETWGDNCVTPSVMTNPYHIVEIDKTNYPINFITQKTVDNC